MLRSISRSSSHPSSPHQCTTSTISRQQKLIEALFSRNVNTAGELVSRDELHNKGSLELPKMPIRLTISRLHLSIFSSRFSYKKNIISGLVVTLHDGTNAVFQDLLIPKIPILQFGASLFTYSFMRGKRHPKWEKTIKWHFSPKKGHPLGKF